MNDIVTALRENPELATFLTVAVGFTIGRIRIGSFSLGNVVGTLLAGVVIGRLDIKVSTLVNVVFFDLFPVATGYRQAERQAADVDSLGPEVIGVVGFSAGPSVVAGLRERGRAARRALRPEDEPRGPVGCVRRRGHGDGGAPRDPGRSGEQAPRTRTYRPYAIGNILFTAWGPVIVMLTR